MEITNIKEKFLDRLRSRYLSALIYIVLFAGSIYLGNKNFLVYHTVIELVGVIIGFAMSIISINTYNLNKDNRIIFLGVAFGFIAFTSLIHLLGYKGMNISNILTFNTSIQLWLVGTYIQSISFLICFMLPHKRYSLARLLFTYSLILGLVLISIFYLHVFPAVYIEGVGFTHFKLIIGYINCGILLIGLLYLIKNKPKNLSKADKALNFSIVFKAISELIFLFYSSVGDFYSVIGHVFELLSFYYIYIALVRSSLQEPHYSLIELNNILSNKNERLESLVNRLALECEERKKVEVERQRKKQILNGILESVVDGILVINNNGKILRVNNQFINMLNIPFDVNSKTTNHEVIDFVMKQIENPEEFLDHIKNEWKIEKEYIQYMYLKDGRIIETSSVPLFDNNTIQGRVIVYRDITEKRKIEELQKQVEIRQASLEKAREFDQLKTDFFCTVSHELKTPINIILGVIQLAAYTNEGSSECVNGFSNKYIKMMKQNCYRLIKLANNLIDITKIDAGYTEMKIRNHNIVSVIEDITLSVAEYVKSKDISLVFDTDIEVKTIACDGEQLERVMLNLLSNAIKYTDAKGEIEVYIKDKEDSVVISVKDSGVGIPKDKIDIVFDRFRQVDSTLTRQKEGSGIGLALVKSIIEKHGGSISLKSEIGKGSEFIIELPVKVVDENIVDEVAATKDMNVDRINIEFSDIYELNVY
ncbi:MASE3 domain-containing sensor histidine kinase [Clostridium cylindrosporum]|uniref:histidine kinase n=1 Tax=Clostridium cylindrosporum DSM 605 TaxID=1121307 RepID=A0A0J8DCG1_CLOCY|nr:MASE3 domain-containing protein [Clostridium cylindrosporum]KMT21943.1 sensor histidine kinase ResE [Clostridium cylindrosporum DSM 605]